MNVYYMSSLDSSRFEQVRRCNVVRTLVFDTGKSAVVADLDPAVTGQYLERAGDVSRFILAARFEGDDVTAIKTFPCFVYICLPKSDWPILNGPVSAAELDIVGWGELYRTPEDASAHRFDA